MTAIAHSISETDVAPARAGVELSAEVFRDLPSVEALWRKLEAGRDCVGTPYQRYDWVSAFVASEPAVSGPNSALRILVLRDEAGHPQALVPTRLIHRHGMIVARVIGDKHANFHMPLFASRTAISWPPQAFEAAIAKAGRAAGIDVFALDHQPRFWNGLSNPLGVNGRRCASDAYGLRLGPDSEETLRRVFRGEARKKFRSKERKLIELVGPISYRQAVDPGEINTVLEAFFVQKAARFAAMGIANPYANAAIRACLERAALGGDPGKGTEPAVTVHALMAERTGRVLATFIGAVDHDRFSGMCNSFDGDPEISRSSPGDLLLYDLIGKQAAAGRTAFDLGIGEARYKASICDETVELVETIVPVTARGQLYRYGAVLLATAKRRIKQSPKLWDAVLRLRRLRRPLAA